MLSGFNFVLVFKRKSKVGATYSNISVYCWG